MGEEGDAAPVGTCAEHTEVRLDQLVEKPRAEEKPGRKPDRKDDDETTHRRVGVQDEVGAENGRDRTTRPEVRYSRVGGGPERERHQRLRHRRDESAGEVKEEITKR